MRSPAAAKGSTAAAGAFATAAGLFAAAATASSFVTRPSLPVPEIAAGSNAFSAAILRAAGDSTGSPAVAAAAGSDTATSAAGAAGAVATASVSSLPNSSPLKTVAPSSATI